MTFNILFLILQLEDDCEQPGPASYPHRQWSADHCAEHADCRGPGAAAGGPGDRHPADPGAARVPGAGRPADHPDTERAADPADHRRADAHLPARGGAGPGPAGGQEHSHRRGAGGHQPCVSAASAAAAGAAPAAAAGPADDPGGRRGPGRRQRRQQHHHDGARLRGRGRRHTRGRGGGGRRHAQHPAAAAVRPRDARGGAALRERQAVPQDTEAETGARQTGGRGEDSEGKKEISPRISTPTRIETSERRRRLV